MASTPGTPRLLRAINDRAALDLLLAHGPLSRTTLGDLTGLSKPTAVPAALPARERRAGPHQRHQRRPPGPERPAVRDQRGIAYVAGLDVTPTRIRSAVADITGKIVGDYELPTPGRSAKGTVERVRARRSTAPLGEAGLTRDRLHRVSIGTPGAFDPTTGRLRYARHLPGWHEPHLLEELAAAIAVPLEVDNDVNLAAIAEMRVGHAHDSDNFVLLWGDEGIGAAIVIDGQLVRGAHRRCRRGRLPAAARHAAGARRRPRQRRRLPGTGRRRAGARHWPARSACAPVRRKPRSPPRCTTPGAGDDRTGRVRRAVSRSAWPRSSPWSTRSWSSSPVACSPPAANACAT